MKEFLKVVAEGYKERYPDLSFLTFVMPNKRSGSFLIKYLREMAETTLVSPRIITISDLVEHTIDKVVDSRIDLIFRLYECYCRLQKENEELPFERFSSWGETILNDFNEIDMHMVDAEIIFRNVNDLNAIRTNFLSDQQRKVMTEYFGYSPELMMEDTGDFWKSFEDISILEEEEKKGHIPARKKFYTLWQLLRPLYVDLKESLRKDGLTTTGGTYREAAANIESGYEPYKGEKLIFVGFNALSESERRMFLKLKEMSVDIGLGEESKADFIWDPVSSELGTGEDDPAQRFISINSRKENLPAPEWIESKLELYAPVHLPEIEVIAVPSNVMQVKVACQRLNMIKEKYADSIQDEKVAVILPDESLLLPLLHSLPESFPEPNLTMGFPLKHTAVISFASLLQKLHSHARISKGENAFLYEDVVDILSHPYSKILFTQEKISKFIEFCGKRKFITVTGRILKDLGKNSDVVFRVFGEDELPGVIIDYIISIVALISVLINTEENLLLTSDVERSYIACYADALVRLKNCLSSYLIKITPAGIFKLAHRLIAGETIAFEGEPLKGLQIMGVLETRCLDFERIVMVCVNEKVMPRVGRNSTFIPNALRYEYGMPPANYQEEIFAYYFFRIIGRSRQALLTYDSRSSDTRTSGPSRYLLQMKYLPGGPEIKEKEARFNMPVKDQQPIIIEKDDRIIPYLEKYTFSKDGKNFSASALNDYFNCPVRFLYRYVLGIKVDTEKPETIDPLDLGTIVHGVIEKLYIPDPNKRGILLKEPEVITEDTIDAILRRKLPDGKSYVEELTRREILKVHFNFKEEKEREKEELRGSAALILEYVVGFVKNILLADKENAPFRLWGSEIKETLRYDLPGGKKVNLTMVIDRLDQEGSEDPHSPFRIVDYKTGNVHLTANTLEEIFTDSSNSKNIFQLFLYAELLIRLFKTPKREGGLEIPYGLSIEEFEKKLKMAIYSVLQLPSSTGVAIPKIDNEKIDSVGTLRTCEGRWGVSFMDLLNHQLEEILNKKIPFEAVPTADRCRYCDYRLRCEVRSIKDYLAQNEKNS